jgi:hypothetical protein
LGIPDEPTANTWPSVHLLFVRQGPRGSHGKAPVKGRLELPNTINESVTSSDRYFPATILGGHLHVRGIPDWGPWNPSRLEWADEAFVDMLLSKDQADRKARTREELEAVMTEPKRAPSREVWMHESLVDDARWLWEQMVAGLECS